MAKRRKNAEPNTVEVDDELPEYASPPCYRHEIDPAYFGESDEHPAAEPSDPAEESDP
tara:strand:+ start:1943 stop:2116 length:174 start_codon:yes stop_codon:yes gene_type:complete